MISKQYYLDIHEVLSECSKKLNELGVDDDTDYGRILRAISEQVQYELEEHEAGNPHPAVINLLKSVIESTKAAAFEYYASYK